jgi:hypothetical protein
MLAFLSIKGLFDVDLRFSKKAKLQIISFIALFFSLTDAFGHNSTFSTNNSTIQEKQTAMTTATLLAPSCVVKIFKFSSTNFLKIPDTCTF